MEIRIFLINKWLIYQYYNNMKTSFITFAVIAILAISTHAAYDPAVAKSMTYVAGLAYCPAKRILSKQCNLATQMTDELGMEVIHAMDNGLDENSITYVILKRDSTKEIFVGYSGTRDVAQLISEALEAFPISYGIHPEVKGALVVDYFYKHYLNGFRDDLMKVMPGILAQYPGYDFIFTGHSLGGSLTVHGASDFILNGWGENRKVTVITFGQPRTGNPAFNNGFKPRLAGWYRLDHYRDIVPHVPPCIPGITVQLNL